MSTLTTQKKIAAALGISKQKLSKLIHENKIQLPPVILTKNNTRYYDAIATDKFIKSEPLNPENLLLTQAISNKPGRPQIDNIMATQFITRASASAKPKTLADIVKAHRPKTKNNRRAFSGAQRIHTAALSLGKSQPQRRASTKRSVFLMHDAIELIRQHNPTIDHAVVGFVTLAIALVWLILKIMR